MVARDAIVKGFGPVGHHAVRLEHGHNVSRLWNGRRCESDRGNLIVQQGTQIEIIPDIVFATNGIIPALGAGALLPVADVGKVADIVGECGGSESLVSTEAQEVVLLDTRARRCGDIFVIHFHPQRFPGCQRGRGEFDLDVGLILCALVNVFGRCRIQYRVCHHGPVRDGRVYDVWIG